MSKRWVNTQLGRRIEWPDSEEDAATTEAAQADPDAAPLTDEEWQAVKPSIKRGRPLAAVKKERITIRLSPDVVERFRRTGQGWQTRVDEALKDWLKRHQP